MKKTRNIYLLAVVIFTTVAGGTWYSKLSDAAYPQEGKAVQQLHHMWTDKDCVDRKVVEFSVSPMRLEDIGHLLPMGLMVDAHVTPTDHMYFAPAVFNSPRDAYNVYALADGFIVSLSRRTKFVGDNMPANAKKTDEYQVIIEYSCTLFTYYDLLTSLSSDILEQTEPFDDMSRHQVHIPVKAGQILGKIGGQTLDFAVMDQNKTLKGFINPAHYGLEKLHTADPFDYFKEPLRSKLLALNLRIVKPYGGKIDYDISGKLVGNWFKENTKGYYGTNRARYWDGHLTLAYNYLDPTSIVVSIGDFGGVAKQFGVVGNMPDPAKVDVKTGLVKYELRRFDYVRVDNKKRWDRTLVRTGLKVQLMDEKSAGVVLAQVLKNGKLKVEIFPGKTVAEVGGFTRKALIYER